MFHWNTDKIANDLAALSTVNAVEATTKGGDVDTTNLIVSAVGSTTQFYICGFVTWDNANGQPGEIDMSQADDCDVEMIHLTDGECGSGGLNSKCRNASQCYIDLRQYFVDQGAEVVERIDDYF
jgi:hypothetical protein